ncbi:hypothetical protein PR202_ga02988 [Eleusine coracana subsp. coracana]|uniref:RIC1 C-terminal alpha solenoid region domain-containing protein n=1 Tax=Eleusine coracana subsp. coracana TaxID=191504 RepID=A0AAV5BMX7_ELECO|nr:hypothetical protein PR202_ga02988 [Eleusine coracana subsp. coracana]
MYLAYGWPQSIPLDPDDSDRVVLLRVLGRLLLAVCPASLHLWSATQHRVRLARFDRSPDSLAAHGHNAHAVWSPDSKTVAVLTSSFYLHIYKVQFSGKPLIVGGKPLPGLCLASISPIIAEKQFPDSFKLGCSECSSEKPTAIIDALVFDPPSLRENSNARPAPCCSGNSSIVHVELSVKLRYSVEDTGPVACISWTPDNCAFAVGWKFRGLTVWYELLFFPRYHLDYSSLLYRKPLLGRPIVMDVFQDYILVTYSPFDVHIFHVMISGELSPANSPVLQVSTVRELSIMSPKSPPVSMRFIPEQNDEGSLKRGTTGSSNLLSQQPSRCLILRMNGEFSVLDMDDGHEHALTNSVELFWLDPELEFDREVYPLGLLPNVGVVVVGVSQRMSFSTAEFPCFEPSPQAQTILHCLLRHLLQRDKAEEALRLANLSAEKPHFSHCLEWLLFTVFDADISRPSSSRKQVSQNTDPSKKSLLEKTCDLLRNFPEYMDVVVSVARKTDGRHWADLFSAAGRSTESLLSWRALQSATLDESLYELAGELVRFLLRSGRDFENATTDSEKLSPRFLKISWLFSIPVLVDLFRHDLRLWKAYSITLQSHDVFREYLDLLNVLEEQLSSVSDLTLQNGQLS